jgi:hypothetical protein
LALIFKPSNHETSKALCRSRVPFFIVEKSVVMVYNKLLIFADVTGDYSDSWFRERYAYERRKKT